MTTTAEQFKKTNEGIFDKQREEAATWLMPPLTIGQEILWYPHSDTNQDPHIGTVTYIGLRAIECKTHTTATVFQARDSVKHRDDPDLILKPQLRKAGCWDYTDEFKRRVKSDTELDKKLESLNQRLTVLEKGNDSKVEEKKTWKPTPVLAKRGRPVGSKNKPKETPTEVKDL